MFSRVSIADIANALGLSRNTVSKALNGSAGITNETRQRVLDHEYVHRIVKCGKPCVFFDCAIDTDDIEIPFDIVLQGERGLYAAIETLHQKGYTRFGFVGDPNHCAGFRNRYDYFRLALADLQLHGHEKYSILTSDELMHQPDSYRRVLRSLDIPEVFVCANAMIAIQLMNAVRKESITMPAHSGLVAFETTHDLFTHGKTLVTVNVSRKQIAAALCMLLFDRMQNPDTTKRTIKLNSHIEVF